MGTDTILGLIGLAGGTVSGFMLGSFTKSVRLTGFGLLLLSLLSFAYFSESKVRAEERKVTALENKLEALMQSTDDQSDKMQQFRNCFNRRMDGLDALSGILECELP